MRETFLRTIRLTAKHAFFLFGGHPYRYWHFFIFACAIVFLGIIAFDVRVYRGITKERLDFSEELKKELKRVDEEALRRVFDVLGQKEARFNEILSAPPFEDPSL